jgi:DNA repair protein RecO (recombination protein O)
MYYTIKGLILKTKIQGEQDKLVTIYSYEWGKICAVVPSAKKIAAKLASATEPLTESEFIVFNSHSVVKPKVTGANIIENNTKLKTDFSRSIYSLYAAEISDRFTPFNLKNTEKYNLIVKIWNVLGVCKRQKRALTAFVLRFLKLSGYSFSDYLKQDNIFVDGDIAESVKKLSNCPGSDIDFLENINDEKIWSCVEFYITNYIRRPSLSIFLKKINNYRE